MIPQAVGLCLPVGRGRHPSIVCPAPGAGEVDLGLGIDECEWRGEVPRDEGDCSWCGVAGFLQLNGAAQAGDAGTETWGVSSSGLQEDQSGEEGGGRMNPMTMIWEDMVWFGLVVVVVVDTAEIGCKSRSYRAWAEAGRVQAKVTLSVEQFTPRRPSLVDSRCTN